MSKLINDQTYNIITETGLASVLSHYSTEFVISVLEETIKSKYETMPIVQFPNVVSAWESNFKMIMQQYRDLPQTQEEVMRVRSLTFIEIIDKICESFNLEFSKDENINLYTAAFVLYDFFVCKFSENMVNFFASYITAEKDSIYEYMNLAEYKKDKNASIIYGKKVFNNDTKLAIIIANINQVIYNLSNQDISLENIFGYIPDTNLSNYLKSLVSDKEDFFKEFYVKIIQGDLRTDYLTAIRLRLQALNFPNAIEYDS